MKAHAHLRTARGVERVDMDIEPDQPIPKFLRMWDESARQSVMYVLVGLHQDRCVLCYVPYQSTSAEVRA